LCSSQARKTTRESKLSKSQYRYDCADHSLGKRPEGQSCQNHNTGMIVLITAWENDQRVKALKISICVHVQVWLCFTWYPLPWILELLFHPSGVGFQFLLCLNVNFCYGKGIRIVSHIFWIWGHISQRWWIWYSLS
jgi:hypothetical protein